MDGLWILLLLILISALPVFLIYLWFRSRQFPMSPLWFFLSLLAGFLSLGIGYLLPLPIGSGRPPEGSGLGILFFTTFVRIALTEETGRLLALSLLFRAGRGLEKRTLPYSPAFGAATGLLAGLGFAIIENASYGAADMGIALFRAFTAAPLHGACGARVGLSAVVFKAAKIRALLHFLSALVIHGMYNFMILSPGIPAFFSVLVAFSALFSSILLIR